MALNTQKHLAATQMDHITHGIKSHGANLPKKFVTSLSPTGKSLQASHTSNVDDIVKTISLSSPVIKVFNTQRSAPNGNGVLEERNTETPLKAQYLLVKTRNGMRVKPTRIDDDKSSRGNVVGTIKAIKRVGIGR